MIILRTTGGLGNQLFQYAAARSLSHRHQVPLRFDARWHNEPHPGGETVRSFDLLNFCVSGERASPSELGRFWMQDRCWHTRLTGKLLRPLLRRELYWSPKMGLDRQLQKLGPEIYLDGLFQHPAHFAQYELNLKSELQFRSPLPKHIQNEVERLARMPSVCIQVRRSDFLENPAVSAVHHCCEARYYEIAWKRVKSYVPEAQGYIFTDDLAWAKENFRSWSGVEIIGPEWDGPNYLHKFALMRSCRHFIIANSTYGWWAAWLGATAGSRVVLPQRWLRNAETVPLGLLLPGWEAL